MWKALVSVSVLASALTFGASAQLSGQSGPIQIEADTLEFLDKQSKAIYMGNVDAIQGDARIRTDKLTILFDEKQPAEGEANSGIGSGVGAVRELLAEGSVFYMTPNEQAKGNRGVYIYKDDTIVLTGDVIVTRGENVIVGDRLVIEVGSGKSTVSANSKKKGERVRTVLVTEEADGEE